VQACRSPTEVQLVGERQEDLDLAPFHGPPFVAAEVNERCEVRRCSPPVAGGWWGGAGPTGRLSKESTMTTTSTHPGPTLVLGATGKTGRRVADRLAAHGVAVRHGSRAGDPPFTWQDRATWAPVLAGVRAVYISYFPDLSVAGAADDIAELARLAGEAGVEHLVLLSGRGEVEAEVAEQVVQASGLAWSVVRASWFNQNFTESYMCDPVIDGMVVLPAGDVAEPFVDADDIADVAVAALTDPGRHAGQLYEVTGPRALTFAEAVAEIGKAVDRPIRYEYVPVEAYADEARAAGVPEDDVALLTYLFSTILDGRNSAVADGVQRALGREPRDFYDFAWDAAQAGAWDRG
jgi:uncharacterized protein YbjT (DUF2867 family)